MAGADHVRVPSGHVDLLRKDCAQIDLAQHKRRMVDDLPDGRGAVESLMARLQRGLDGHETTPGAGAFDDDLGDGTAVVARHERPEVPLSIITRLALDAVELEEVIDRRRALALAEMLARLAASHRCH